LGALFALLIAGCALPAAKQPETVSTVGGHGAAGPAAAPAVPDPMALGRLDAPLVLVEFSDYQCPYCRRFHAEVLPRLRREYIDTGKLRLVYKDLPLDMHREAMPAALAARCAAQLERFWPMNEALFANQAALGAALYTRLAQELALDGERFRSCTADPATRRLVQRDARDARRFGIQGTPGFILGRSAGAGVQVERIARGFADFDTFAREIDALLGHTGTKP
jgi:protein-disulfide isomerase